MSMSLKNDCLVLMYHRVRPSLAGGSYFPNKGSTVALSAFEEQINYLERHFLILSPDKFMTILNAKASFPDKSVLLTFDDGQIDFYEYTYQVLKRRGLPAVVFLPTGFISTHDIFWWDKLEWCLFNTKMKSVEIFGKWISLKDMTDAMPVFDKIIKASFAGKEKEALDVIAAALAVSFKGLGRSSINWDEAKEMAGNGISFGGHTQNHIKLSETPDDLARKEIFNSKEIIETMIGGKARSFAYPYGTPSDFLPIHEQMVKEAGYEAAFSTINGPVDNTNNRYSLKRIRVSGYDSMLTFCLKLALKSDSLPVKVIRGLLR